MEKFKLLSKEEMKFFSFLKIRHLKSFRNKNMKKNNKISILNNMINHIQKLNLFSQKMKIKHEERRRKNINRLVKLFIQKLKNKLKIKKIINRSKTNMINRKNNNSIKKTTLKFISSVRKLKIISDLNKIKKSKKKNNYNKYYISNKVKKINNLKNNDPLKYYYSYAKNKLKKDIFNFSIKNKSKSNNNSSFFLNKNNLFKNSNSINKKENKNKKLDKIKLKFKTFRIINNN